MRRSDLISLILPYWDRKEAADKALTLLAKTYPHANIEVVIVDDGNAEPYTAPDVGLAINYVRLPIKSGPKSPATAWNEGVKASSGDIVVLSCIEILHETPVLEQMAEQVRRMGARGYVLASAWCPEYSEWHCHSTVEVPDCPPGVGIAFCGAMHRELFDKVGGFDEDYRDGAGFEDRDFINRLLTAGAVFRIRDDLKVIHPKTGAQIQWGADAFARNEHLFYSKWPGIVKQKALKICCVNADNYLGRGVEYVNNLHDMVCRNMPDGVPFTFIVFTDSPGEYTEGIQVRHLPIDGLTGWHNKIALFHRRAFTPGDRVIFFDLDTLITGPLDEVIGYDGPFAILEDFWRPGYFGPAVMMWEAGQLDDVWEAYEQASWPNLPRGDQEWLEAYFIYNLEGFSHRVKWSPKKPDILQKLYPNRFVSYKTHCLPYPPQDASVVCFHGLPRPHECMQKWVQDVWKIDGASSLNLTVVPNTDTSLIFENIKANKKKATWVCESPAHNGHALICASGPSLLDDIETIKAGIEAGCNVFALNNAANILAEHGIKADFQVILDARPGNIDFMKGNTRYYLLASQVHPILMSHSPMVTLQWHPYIDGIENLFPDDPMTLIGGGTTVGLSAIALAHTLGYREASLFGYDSSFRSGAYHAAPQARTEAELRVFDVTAGEKTFQSNAAMAKQAELFPAFAKQLAEAGMTLRVFGDGLLPHIAHSISTQPLTT